MVCIIVYARYSFLKTRTLKLIKERSNDSTICLIVTAKWVSDAYNLRQLGDYDFESTISDDTAIQLLQHAHQFYELAEQYLTNGKGQS
ncbi:hypothetical protein CLV58_11967 [Spirosoma oryzae]|uniref:HEPN domain-containing protein n=1 Tax=Spirosoma oryzae TaxID=1469603 RepID=A0A2T0SKH1_9BACT|nr:hypothetical protein CLV58_11967 [Spirosoma oryzae]